mgnify:CR=1 FL=1|jgi:hypothetical protein
MGIFQIIMVFFSGITLGGIIHKYISDWSEKNKKDHLLSSITKQFKQIQLNITRGKSSFKNRVNNTVFIKSSLEDHGDVDIVYIMDSNISNRISIFQESKCIYTSDSIEKDIIDEISFIIEKRYKKQIEDVVDILGLKFYRPDFEKTFDFEKAFKDSGIDEHDSDIEKIQMDNDSRFDIDDVLDKISKEGMESLSDSEKLFLEDYSRNNG